MRLAFAVPVLLLAAACGGGASATTASDEPATIDSMAKTLGCSPTPVDTAEDYVRAEASCKVDGEGVTLIVFADNADRDAFIKVAETFGGKYLRVKAGAYGVETDEAMKVVKDKVG